MNKKIVMLLAAIILLFGTAYFVTNANKDKNTGANFIDIEPVDAIGFEMKDFEGNIHNLDDFKGEIIVLNFFASKCSPCKEEMPSFDQVYLDYQDDVEFVMLSAIGALGETEESARDYVESHGFSFPVYFDHLYHGQYIYGVSSIPSTVIIDENYQVVKVWRGLATEEQLRNAIEDVL